jgi:hypothetical protein
MTDNQTTARTLSPLQSLSGHDAYCHVCWEPIYRLWIDKENDPAGQCIHGAAAAHSCPEAMARAANSAGIAKLKAAGVIYG